jgi:hypothetical protein
MELSFDDLEPTRLRTVKIARGIDTFSAFLSALLSALIHHHLHYLCYPLFYDYSQTISAMSKLFRRKPKDSTAPIPGLEQTKLILGFVSSLGDGAISVPGLKAVAQIAIKVIEVAQVRFAYDFRLRLHLQLSLPQKAQSNKADCILIAERIRRLTEDLISSLGDQQAPDLDPRLKRDLDRFER